MARLQSIIASVIRGSVGGITYTAGRNHAIVMRSRVGPARLPTNNGNTARTSLQSAIAQWLAMSPSDRNLWNDYAQTCSFSGPLGNYNITGMQMFIRTCMPIQYAFHRDTYAFVWDDTPPVIPGFPNIGPITIQPYVGPGTGVALHVFNNSGEDAVAMIRVSIPWNSTRLKDPGKWDTDQDQSFECLDQQTTFVEIDNLVEGMTYFISIRMILKEAPFRLDTEYVFRTEAVTVAGP